MVFGLQEDSIESRKDRTQEKEKKIVDVLEAFGMKMTKEI